MEPLMVLVQQLPVLLPDLQAQGNAITLAFVHSEPDVCTDWIRLTHVTPACEAE